MKTCKQCGGDIPPSRKHPRTLFCCDECQREWWKQNGRSTNNRELPEMDLHNLPESWKPVGRRAIAIPCLYCGKVNVTEYSQVLRGGGRYCSLSHAWLHRWDGGSVAVICPMCGKEHNAAAVYGTPYCTKCRRKRPWLPGMGQTDVPDPVVPSRANIRFCDFEEHISDIFNRLYPRKVKVSSIVFLCENRGNMVSAEAHLNSIGKFNRSTRTLSSNDPHQTHRFKVEFVLRGESCGNAIENWRAKRGVLIVSVGSIGRIGAEA